MRAWMVVRPLSKVRQQKMDGWITKRHNRFILFIHILNNNRLKNWGIKGESSIKKTYSVSLCHLFTFYLSEKEVWEPCGVTWHFVIRLIVFPAGWSPSNLPHTQHFTTAPRPFAIFWIYGSVRTGLQRWKRMPLQDNGMKKQKSQSNCRTAMVLVCCVFHGLTSSWSHIIFFPHEMSCNKVCLSPQNCQKLLFSVSELWRVLVRMTRVIVRSLSDKISSVLLPFPCKNSRIWM